MSTIKDVRETFSMRIRDLIHCEEKNSCPLIEMHKENILTNIKSH